MMPSSLLLLPFSSSPVKTLTLNPFPRLRFSTRPFHFQNPCHRRPQTPAASFSDAEDEVVVGDCLVFEDGAFEEESSFSSSPSGPYREKAAAAATGDEEGESLVPKKWKEAVDEINLTKKEKRRIAHQIRFGSRLEKRRPAAVPAAEEYRAYREAKLAQLRPVVLDDPDPRKFAPAREEEAAASAPPPEPGARAAPRNPRRGVAPGSLEDIAEFFSSGEYVPGEMDDDKNPRGRRKLFTKEEKILLNRRIPDLEFATCSKWLPLHTLAASGEFYLLDKLLKYNVDINSIDKDGLSAIHKAILSKKQAITNYLLRNSANPFIRDKDGATLMHYAVQTASSQTIKILLLYDVDINLSDDYGWTPLHLAVQTQRTDIVKLLLIKGADRTLKNQDGLTPVELCLYLGHHPRTYELIKLLRGFPSSKQHD